MWRDVFWNDDGRRAVLFPTEKARYDGVARLRKASESFPQTRREGEGANGRRAGQTGMDGEGASDGGVGGKERSRRGRPRNRRARHDIDPMPLDHDGCASRRAHSLAR